MATFQLKLEVDSAAHPELHQMLVTIENPSFRAERMRQLASTGLIWERLRLSPQAPVETAAEHESIPRGVPLSSHLALVSKPSRHDALGLPVLRDEVPASQMPQRPEVDLPQTTESLPLVDPPNPHGAYAPLDTAPAIHMSGKRSRLMRMKNRGLFANE